jgi:hypothetical protein
VIGLRLLRISDELLISLLAPGVHPHGYEVLWDGIPPDARIVDIVRMPGECRLKIASTHWSGPAEGEIIETICTRVQMLDAPKP